MYKICRECHAIFDGGKWFYDQKLEEKLRRHNEAGRTLCTACKRIRDRIACGVVYLDADIIKDKEEEIIKLIRREEEVEKSHNHLSRILNIYRDGDRLVVETINQQLAVHIGKKMKKMYGGHLEITGGLSGHHSRGEDDREEVIVKWKRGGDRR